MTKVNALLMNAADNVVTTVVEIAKGEEVVFLKDGELLTIRAEEDIPYCHKVALKDLPQSSEVIKYGESLGREGADGLCLPSQRLWRDNHRSGLRDRPSSETKGED